MADLNEIVDTLSGLTVMEAAELAKLLEEKWGVSAAAPVAVAAAAGPAAAGGEAADQFPGQVDGVLGELGVATAVGAFVGGFGAVLVDEAFPFADSHLEHRVGQLGGLLEEAFLPVDHCIGDAGVEALGVDIGALARGEAALEVVGPLGQPIGGRVETLQQ